jgi:hypothetical protein
MPRAWIGIKTKKYTTSVVKRNPAGKNKTAEKRCMRMNIRHSVTILLFLLIPILAASCGNDGAGSGTRSTMSAQTPVEQIPSRTETTSQNPLVGVWVSGKYRLLFKADNAYSRYSNGDNGAAVLGSVITSGNVLVITDDPGSRASCVPSLTGQVGSGSYTVSVPEAFSGKLCASLPGFSLV